MDYRILGPLEVSDGDRVVDLGGHKQRAILAMLLIEAGRSVSTDALIDRLWGEEPPATALGTLQAYVSNLRRALEPGRPARRAPKLLLGRAGGYALQAGDGELDAERFERLARQGRNLLRKEAFSAARESLEAGLALWRGPALSDFAFDPFATEEIVRLHELRMSALEDRIDADLALGHHGALVAELRPLVERHPLRERLRARLMLALYRYARQAEALEVYQQGRARLADDLGIDPGPELRRLEEQILRQDPALDWRPPPVAASRTPAAGPLLGRDAELAVLSRAAESARAGSGRLVFVAGEPGIGKTRLMEEFASGLDGFEVAWGRCYEGEGAPPLWPWLNLLRSIAGPRSQQELLELAGGETSELVLLLPQLAAADDERERNDTTDAEEARFRLYVAVSTLLARIADGRPVALLLDDLHWADVATLRLIHFLANELRDSRILVIGTYRDVEVDSDHPLSETLASVARLPVVERLVLEGLAEDDVASYVSSVVGYAPPQASVRSIHERTAGNPFFVAELVRLLETEGDLKDADPAAVTAVPANVRDVILRRVSALPDVSARILRSAAVIGREFDSDLIGRVDQLENETVLDAIEPAVASRIVAVVPGVLGSYRFSHALVRETLYESIATGARAIIHSRAAEALEAVSGDDEARVSEIAHHLFEAVGIGPVHKAVDYALRAADHALAHIAFEQAEEHLRRALMLVERMPHGPEVARREFAVQVRLSGLLMMNRGYAVPEAATRLARARDLARDLDDQRRLLPVQWRLCAFHMVRADMKSALEAAEEVLEAARVFDDADWRWSGHQQCGIVALQSGELAAAREHLQRTLALTDSIDASVIAEVIPERDATVSSLGFLGWAHWLLGDRARAYELVEEQLTRARRLDHPFGVAFALLFGAFLGAMDHDAAFVRKRSDEQIRLARDRGFRLYEAAGEIYLGWATAVEGDAESGTGQLQAGLAGFEAGGARMLAGVHYALLGEAHRLAGENQEALAAIEQGLERARSTGERFFDAELHRVRGELLLQISPERAAEAEADLRRAAEVARIQGAGALETRAEASLKELGQTLLGG